MLGTLLICLVAALFFCMITSRIFGEWVLSGGLQFTRFGQEPALFDRLRLSVRAAGIVLVWIGVFGGPLYGLIAGAIGFGACYNLQPPLRRWIANIAEFRDQRITSKK